MTTQKQREETYRRTQEDLETARATLENAQRAFNAAVLAECEAWGQMVDPDDEEDLNPGWNDHIGDLRG
jgi:hypothetical protein